MRSKVGLIGLCCVIVWSATSPAFSLDVETLKKGVVRVTATIEEGKAKVGTGFIVRRQANADLYCDCGSCRRKRSQGRR